jgi:hypothetical protein
MFWFECIVYTVVGMLPRQIEHVVWDLWSPTSFSDPSHNNNGLSYYYLAKEIIL